VAAREDRLTDRLSLSLSLANACNPLLQAHPPWAQDNRKPRFSSSLCSVSRRPIWAGARSDNLLVSPGTPGVETPTAVNKGLLFPNVDHKCLMAKDDKNKKVKSRASTKYTTSSDEDSSSDDEDNLLALFANLNMQQKEKLNELIGVIHEKDELLDSQEEFLIKENQRHVKF
jgi:hypothetical protein